MPDLRALGWNADIEASFVERSSGGLVPGRVSLEHNHVYRVLTADGEWLAEAAGRIKHAAEGRVELPAVGDWVGLRPTPAGERAMIRMIMPRRSCFSRKAAGRGTREQVVAANIDVVFLVSSLETSVKPRSVERYLVLARESGAQPVIILNKADCAKDLPATVGALSALAPGTPLHAVSARDGRGFEWLETYLSVGRTVALLGASGAGKSSIVNRLVGHDVLATGEVRPWDARGRHISVHRQLIVLDRGGIVIDTPGMRELEAWDSGDSVDETFADLVSFAGACRFRDCQHDQEPGCAVKAAVADGRLDASRHESYVTLIRERAALSRKQDERAWLDESKRQGKVTQKTPRPTGKKR